MVWYMQLYNKLKRKLCCLIERIKLSESDYRAMKAKSQMYNAMMSNVKATLNTEYKDIMDNHGNVVATVCNGVTMTIDIDIVQMLAAGGITFDGNKVKLNVIGL